MRATRPIPRSPDRSPLVDKDQLEVLENFIRAPSFCLLDTLRKHLLVKHQLSLMSNLLTLMEIAIPKEALS